MTDDLVKRLRAGSSHDDCETDNIMCEAADCIWAQNKRIEKLEAALRHCVNAIAEVEKCKLELLTYKMAFSLRPFLLGAMDNARAALAGEKKDD